jgi:hypothetical protein
VNRDRCFLQVRRESSVCGGASIWRSGPAEFGVRTFARSGRRYRARSSPAAISRTRRRSGVWWISGRANAALNLFHIGGGFALQSAIGFVIGAWPSDAAGHYPPEAYARAFVLMVVLQGASLLWFLLPALRAYRAEDSRIVGAEHERILREAIADRARARRHLLRTLFTLPTSTWRWIHRCTARRAARAE